MATEKYIHNHDINQRDESFKIFTILIQMSSNLKSAIIKDVSSSVPDENVSIPNTKNGDSRSYTAFKSLIGGGISGAVAKTVVAPVDRIKIMYQVTSKPFTVTGAFNQLKSIIETDGIRGLFIGNSATMARVIPYAGIQFMSFDQLKQSMILGPEGRLTGAQRMFCGSAAGAISVIFTYPLDMIRARMAMQFHKKEYLNWRHAIRVIYAQEGMVSLYAGIYPTILGIIPYAGVSFYTYETLKQFARDSHKSESTSTIERLASGAIAGLVGQTLTYPLDIIRRRMQTDGFLHTQNFGHEMIKHRGFVSTIRSLLREDPSGRIFLKGVTMNWFKGPIAVGTSFATFDLIKNLFGIEGKEI